MKNHILCVLLLLLASCESYQQDEGLIVCLSPPMINNTYAFNKLNLQLFTLQGDKVFSKVKTQKSDESNFGTFYLDLSDSAYILIAVGHSCYNSATIKNNLVSFTMHEGRKLTDTYYVYDTIFTDSMKYTFDMMHNVTAFRLELTDIEEPVYDKMSFTYTGGSANFIPKTGIGHSVSTQTETFPKAKEYVIYTFPREGNDKLDIVCQALNGEEVVKTRVFNQVPIEVGNITNYIGDFFSIPVEISFVVTTSWDTLMTYYFW